ncbi:MAG TPA: pilus assembly protein N-terminal domain-containing protein [Bryobacterales bacterium]|nr:pilus assembly protein N-terminal domain-containing protein [Bryobacterales bacterium]
MLWLWPSLSSAQTEPATNLHLTVGRGQLLQFERDVTKLSISEPTIADAVVISPREIVVNAKGAGNTTLLVWEEGSPPKRYEIGVGLDLSQVENELRAAFPQAGIHVSGNENRLILTGHLKDPEQAKQAAAIASARGKEVINLITIPPPGKPRQILLQVKFATIDRTALSAVGFNLLSNNSKTIGSISTQQFGNPRFSDLTFQNQNLTSPTINLTDILNIFAFRPDLNIGATIRLLQSRNLLEILAEPNLLVMENKEASFLAGGEFPFPVVSSTPVAGNVAPVVTVRFKEFGVRLNFAPVLTADGGIDMKVAPEVSALDFSNALTLQGFQIPALSTRRAETEVLLNEGESFAIAGLIDNRVQQTLNRLPGLGDLPIIGRLFRSSSTNKTNDELLVVVTPYIVKPLAPGQSAKLPEFPINPVISPDKQKDAQPSPQPEFVGPRGHQEPQK